MSEKEKLVKVYWCVCGKSIDMVSVLEHAETNPESIKEFEDAAREGRKVEVITLEQFHKTPFMCVGMNNLSCFYDN